MESPKVFISYSHDSPEHRQRVLALAGRLRDEGVDVELDQYETAPAEGWARWMERRIKVADFVLVVCTAVYRQRFAGEKNAGEENAGEENASGLGVKWEGAILTQTLYQQAAQNRRFVPVVFALGDAAHVPLPLAGATHYDLSRKAGYDRLYRRLTRQPEVVRPGLGEVRPRSPRPTPVFDPPAVAPVAPVASAVPAVPDPPRPPAHFTGRGLHLERLAAQLLAGEHVAITALQGMGGIGKTALAQKLAEEIKGRFPGGVLWWSLGPRPDVAGALDAWARSFDPRADLSPYPDLAARVSPVRSMLARLGRLCAIVDDVWQAAAARPLIEAIPAGCPVLITTRRLGVAKKLHCRTERLDQLPEEEAIKLLAKLLGPLGRHRGAAGEIARATDCLPLALEIAAGLIEGPADLPDLAGRLRAGPSLEVLKMPGEEHREQSVEACLALSYGDLDADLKRRFRALGVFAEAPFDRAAMAAVWGDSEEGTAAAAAASLHRRNLVRRQAGGEYRQHALLRAHAEALLVERDEVFARFADHYRRFAEEKPWAETERVWEQISRGWEWVRASSPDRVIGYVGAVTGFLRLRGRRLEVLEWLKAGLEQAGKLEQRRTEGVLLNNIGQVCDDLGRNSEALEQYEKALPIRREVGDRAGEASTLTNIGAVYSALGRNSEALERYEKALPIRREVGDRAGEAITLSNIGAVYDALGRNSEALEQYEKALPISREVGDRAVEAVTLNNIGGVYSAQGRNSEALGQYEKALLISREVGDRWGESVTLFNIGCVLDDLGRTAEAVSFLEQNVALDEELGHPDLESDRAKLEKVRKKL